MNPDFSTSFIDEVAVHHCGHCDAVLGPEAQSKLWCNEEHQALWFAARVGVEPEAHPEESDAFTSYTWCIRYEGGPWNGEVIHVVCARGVWPVLQDHRIVPTANGEVARYRLERRGDGYVYIFDQMMPTLPARDDDPIMQMWRRINPRGNR